MQAPSFSADSNGNGEMFANALSKFCLTHERSDMSCHDNVLLKSIDLLTRMTRKNSLLTVFINIFLSVNCMCSIYSVYSAVFLVCTVWTVQYFQCVQCGHCSVFRL